MILRSVLKENNILVDKDLSHKCIYSTGKHNLLDLFRHIILPPSKHVQNFQKDLSVWKELLSVNKT